MDAEVAGRVYTGASLLALKSETAAAIQEATPSLSPTVKSVAVEMTGRKPGPAIADDSAKPSHLSPAPENSKGPALLAGHTSSSVVPSPLPLTTASHGQASPSGAVPASPSFGSAADLPTTPTLFQPAQNHASLSATPKMPAPQEEGNNGSPPTAASSSQANFLIFFP
ncbi:hypothetical protein HPG69_007337 [Diceros bicornis minor]|uniref:Uncharacterized protein n=1 Tax=Diceros bicornis minor TaxID=77932 RepID=A0A7J7ELG2_DICBM|nr:hypothetical protein HPG69_007337 [Diceros bicornis minor]